MIRTVIQLCSLCLVAAMATAAKAAPATRSMGTGLTREEATRRSLAIENVSYKLSFSLSDKDADKSFSGTVTAHFNVKDAATPLTIDFQDGDVKELVINGRRQAKIQYNKKFVTLPTLRPGENEVLLRFTHPYSTTGAGLYRFKDREDGKSYVYSNFEPFDANNLFPCFDQPDLKAVYKVSVEAPADWTVVTAVREAGLPIVKGKRASWNFPETAKFSTYLFSLIAGPYQVWEGKAGDIPLRLMARSSLGKYVDAVNWLKITQQGLAFYNDYFAFAYPFKKYDQIVVPDFNAGAMENVGAVTFSERFIQRGAVTTAKREDHADVILHEMAHMWFGDLVTMTWWNDLWLNESFATYMAAMATSQATEYSRSWESFYNGTKQWAYWEDQLVTTHPIEGDVPDTEQAFANFDGITYGKGASTLKALAYYIGPVKFREGVQAYFKQHAYGNTTLKDFMGALAKASGTDLDRWTQQWLRTEGLNTVEATFACEGGKVKGFALKQSAPTEHPELRAHRTQVALFRKEANDGVALQKAVSVTYDGASTPVPELDGEACPHIVYPNYEDYDYVKVRLDARSLEAVKGDIGAVKDSLQRSMYWTSLWDAVRDGEWPVNAYADTFLKQIDKEQDDKILEKVLESVEDSRRSTNAVVSYLPPASPSYQAFVTNLEAFAASRLAAAAAGSDTQKLWYDFSVRATKSAAGQENLRQILAGKKTLVGLEIDQDRRWDIVLKLSELGATDAKALRQAEAKRDASSRGHQSAITAEALTPDKAVKNEWYDKITNTKTKMSLADLKAAMSGMLPASQINFGRAFASRYFTDLLRLSKTQKSEFARRFAAKLAPAFCEEASAQALTSFATQHGELPPVALKALRVAAQEDDRCAKIRKLATSG